MTKKPSISTVPQTTTNTVTINNNFSNVQEAFNNTLSLDGSTPNAMQADIDMDGNSIINIGSLVIDGEDYKATLESLVADAEAAKDAAETSETNAANSATDSESAKTDAETAQAAAELARDEAEAAVGKQFATVAAMAAATTGLSEGHVVRVSQGYNTATEIFRIVSTGTFTANGSEVVSLSVSGIQAVSTRLWFTSLADLVADTRTHTTGTILSVLSLSDYEVVASGEHLSNAASVGLKVVPKNNEIIDSAFGVSSSDSTTELATAIAAVASTGTTLVLTQNTTISGVIGSDIAHASASLRIRPVGNVVWTLDSGMTAVNRLCRFESTATASFTATGGLGRLTIDCNNKAGAGIWFRHYGARGGVVDIAALKVVNVLGPTGYTSESCGLGIYGDFDTVTIHPDVIVEDVDRLEASGTCAGITVSGTNGSHSDMVLYSPIVRRVLAGPSGSSGNDADGIKLFNKSSGGRRLGSIKIYSPILDDNQGRQIKTQSEDVYIEAPTSIRREVDTISGSIDFDFQLAPGILVNPTYDYREKAATGSCLSANHYLVSQQHTLTDVAGCGRSIGGRMFTELSAYRYCVITTSTDSGPLTVECSGLQIIPLDGYSGDAFSRCFTEVADMDDLLARAAPTSIIVRNNEGPIGDFPIAYTGYTSGGSPGTYLSWEVSGNKNTGSIPAGLLFQKLDGGGTVVEFANFLIRDNLNYQASFLGATLTFDFQKLTPGCRFYCDFANNTISNGTGLPASGYGLVEVLDGASFMANRTTDRAVRVTPNGTATVYMTHNGGTNWYSNT